jgi:hypothetical protein
MFLRRHTNFVAALFWMRSAMSDKPVGKPYSQIYVQRGKPVEDSPRFRSRLRAYLDELPAGTLDDIAILIAKKTGERVHSGNVARHMSECTLVDLLDNITHVASAMKHGTMRSNWHELWLRFVQEALRDET